MARSLACAITLLMVAPLRAEWKPAPSPLMTDFAKDVSPDKVHPEYPRPQLVRKDWVNLNGLWQYAITAKDAEKPEKWDGEILVPFCVESALSGVGKSVSPNQALWYRRTFKKPEMKDKGRLLLHFQAVDWYAKVVLNGKFVGEHRGGFDPFSFDITDTLKDGEQELIVRVWDPTDQGSQPRGKQVLKPGGIFYTAVTGIWQTVWLEPVPDTYIESIWAETDLDAKTVTVRTTIRGNVDKIVQIATLHDGEQLGEGAWGPAKKEMVLTTKLDKVKPWSPTSPHCYRLRVVLSDTAEKGKGDSIESYVAIRKIEVAKDKKGINRIFLNNEPLFQLGTLDQGWWPDGLLTPPTDEAMAYDLKKLKELGFNMLRKHVKVEPARLYYHCDKLGLLVWQDMPSGMAAGRKQGIGQNAKEDAVFSDEDKKQFRAELKTMIDHLRHFPCIVAWVPFNEGWGQHDTNEILKWTKEYDPTRLVDGPSGWTDRGYGDLKDIHVYPGPGMFPVEKDRVSVLGEFGGLGLPLEGHLWQDKKNWGYRTYKTTEELRSAYHLLMVRLHPLIDQGCAASVYTQTTDVESEVNGLLTYDRKVLKLDAKETARWHKTLFGPLPETRAIVPTSEKEALDWRYTTEKPGDDWMKADFTADKWKTGPGGFGEPTTPGSKVRTSWKSADIWIRRDFDLKELPKGEWFFSIHHDEDAEIYINGVLAAKVTGFVTQYSMSPILDEGRKALKAGKNTIAIHCHQTGGGQHIDAGIVERVLAK
jgi:Glycosyl hydrolases family 2, sugar binding domain/Glycosyl hydrolases family 2, TIM barrel domain/Glycosyl hydrolases family 2